MAIEIIEATDKSDIIRFVKFQKKLYKGNPFYVQPIISDEVATFDRKKNPAYEFSDSKLLIAVNNGEMVGRIAAIHSKAANEKWGTKNLRFGWFESVNDQNVANALFDEVEKWGRELGLNTLTGPHGFCDFDYQGLLIEGFDKLATIAGYYHLPYYRELVENYGFEKDIDFLEYWSTTPYDTGIPEKMIRTAEYVQQRYKFKLVSYRKVKEYQNRGKEILKLLDETFEENYGTVPLTDAQINYYIKKYLPYIHPELVKLVENDKNELIGFMITMPNLSKAYQKANGSLFPFGIFHMLKALKTYDVLDFYLAGVKKEYRGKGVDLLMTLDIVKSAMKLGFKNAESNQELETNTKVQAEWKFFNPVQHKRKRVYKKIIKY